MKRFVRESKFRHIFGQPAPKGQQFEGIEVSKSRLDGNFLACNEVYIACVLSLSNSLVAAVLRRDKPGRYDTIYKLTGHTSEILDVSFDPFCVNRLITGCDNGKYYVWWIPDEGLTGDLSEPIAILQISQRRAVQSIWHFCAKDVIFLACVDKISIANLSDYSIIREIDTSQYCEHLYNISINQNGTKVVASFKDKKVRIFDVLTGQMERDFQPYDGSKPTRVQFADKFGNFLCTTGFTKMSERRVSIWNLDDTSKAISNEELDSGVALMNIHYDVDLSLLVLFSKGSSIFSFYELDNTGKLFLVSNVSQGDQIRAACFANKLACNVSQNEIMHVCAARTKSLDPIGFIVPRKSSTFQEDIFPETNSNIPSMTADDFIHNIIKPPFKISPQSYEPLIGHIAPEKQPSVHINKNVLNISKSISNRNSVMIDHSHLEARIACLEEKVEKLMKERQ